MTIGSAHAWLALVLAACAACSPPSAQRAERDLEIGRAEAAGVAFVVDEGLAAVRTAEPGVLRLWCSAPLVTITASNTSGEAAWRVDLENAMPDAELEAVAGDGSSIDVTPSAGGLPTRKSFTLVLPSGVTSLRITTPDAGDRRPWRFALMSDVQDAMDEVQDVFGVINAQPGVRFLLGAGDLSQSGTREELERFQRELEGLVVPYYTTLGNHDAPPLTPWHELYGRGSFRFVYRGVHFSMVDSASATLDPQVYDWLTTWLAEGRDAVHVVAMHIPPLDPVGVRNGAFGSRGEAGKLLQMLRDGGVDLSLYGHIHSFYQFENAGIPAFISGGGGALPEKLDGIGRHVMVIDIGADGGLERTEVVRVD
jgi:predicted phosphodiesterase